MAGEAAPLGRGPRYIIIKIKNQLKLIITARQVELREPWLEKLRRWDEALGI